LNPEATQLGEEGFAISPGEQGPRLEAFTPKGLLYATFHLLKALQLGSDLCELRVSSIPSCPIRKLDHWDDPKFDHTLGPFNVTRGFAGNSIFHWEDLLEERPRYRDYARLLASIGINAVCLNNVNADPDLLESGYLPGIAAMADRLRPYNIRVYLSVPFTAPMVCDGVPGDASYGDGYPFCMRNRKVRLETLESADPLDPQVQAWWRAKADEIYSLIPDFGGFVIKANSEGMPGPQDYDRSHAEGANCLARALAPHGGILFYRSFVYDWGKREEKGKGKRDVCSQAYAQFKPLDGEFDDNVIVQSKAGPADFRSHEPPNPLFGNMPATRHAVEFMVAQEYLGHTTHICYQGQDWHSILNFDTLQNGPGSTIGGIASGTARGYKAAAIVAVANFGDDANWFGHLFAGANLYAFGALAWNPVAPVAPITAEWIVRTLGPSKRVRETVARILEDSYGVYARYTVPMGMNYMHEGNHHYEPRPSVLTEAIWNPHGAGHNRSVPLEGSFLALYHPDARKHWEDPETTPLTQLLFFHHLPWSHRLPNGKTLAQHMRDDRVAAVEEVRQWLLWWRGLKDDLNPQTWAHVYERMQRQYVHAGKWRDAVLRAMAGVGQAKAAKSASPSEVLV
jgi:alpha-glucuronidase